jgi:hypothetical protein
MPVTGIAFLRGLAVSQEVFSMELFIQLFLVIKMVMWYIFSALLQNKELEI